MNKSNDKEPSYDFYHQLDRRNITLEDSLNIINKQSQEIARLRSELNSVKTERDLLICENSKLKFELDIVDLRRMYSERWVLKCHQMGGEFLWYLPISCLPMENIFVLFHWLYLWMNLLRNISYYWPTLRNSKHFPQVDRENKAELYERLSRRR